jgi:hypothetical protein
MRRPHLISALALFVFLAVAATPALAVDMHTYGRAFCKGELVRDYEAPLDHLPSVRHVRSDEDLPFGPRNMSIYQSALSRVIVGEGGFGYRFFDDTYGRREEVHLDWDVTTTLSRIDRRGQVLRQIASEAQHFGVVTEIDEMDFWLDTPSGPRPALYRYDIEFADHSSGEVLGRYSEYLRVVRPSFHAGIAVDRNRVHPGERVFARVENRGTSWISFGLEYEVQKLEGGRWVEQDLGVDGWLLPLILMRGGGSGWCMPYKVPLDATPGRYRFVKSLGFSGRKVGKRATAPFTVPS